MDYNKTARKLRARIAKFSGELSSGLPLTSRRFVNEMIYGIQASQSVVLTKIGRTLEESVSIKKVEERLSRQLGRDNLGATILSNLLSMAKSLVKEDTLLILDPSDIRKKYAKKMEYLATIRDGSAKELGNGYWLCNAIATEIDGDNIIPLVCKLYSTVAPNHESENREILDTIDTVSNAVNGRGIWVIDRGGDRRNIIVPLLEKRRRFLLRLVGNRHLIKAGRPALAGDIARTCPCPYKQTIVKMDGDKENIYHLKFGFKKVYFPGRDEQLGLLVVKGFGQTPMMLLTTEPVRRSQKVLWHLIKAYMRRWAIEETIRFIKQSYELEDVRILGYRSLQNLMPLVMAAAYFAAVVLDTHFKLKVMVGYALKAAKRLFGIPNFHYYAIADGLNSIFQRCPGRISFRVPPVNDGQLQLLDFGP